MSLSVKDVSSSSGETSSGISTKSRKFLLIQRLSKFYVMKPITCFSTTMSFLFLIAILTVGLNLLELNDFSFEDWLVSTTDAVKFRDALVSARGEFASEAPGGPRQESVDIAGSQYLYSTFDENVDIFTPVNIRAMCQLERKVIDNEDFKKFCITDNAAEENTICNPPNLSVAYQFYINNIQEWETCELLSENDVNLRRQFIYDVLEDKITPNMSDPTEIQQFIIQQRTFRFFVPQKFFETGISTITRSLINLGGPLEGFSEILESPQGAQFRAYRDFYEPVKEDILDLLKMTGNFFNSAFNTPRSSTGFVSFTDAEDGVKVSFYAFMMQQIEFGTLVNSDQVLAIGSAMVVSAAMYWHTKSLFFTGIGMLGIMLSFPTSVFIFKIVLQNPYFNNVQIVALFIILGIGADSVFVIVDAWKQSRASWHLMYKTKQEIKEINEKAKLKSMERFSVAVKDGGLETGETNNSDSGSNTILDSISYPDTASINLFETGDAELEIQIARLAYTLERAYGSVANTALTTVGAFAATALSPVTPVSAFGIFAAILVSVNFTMVLFLHPPMLIIHHRYYEGRSLKDVCSCKNRSNKELEETEYAKNSNDYEHSMLEKIFVNGFNPIMTKHKIFPLAAVLILVAITGVFASYMAQLEPPVEEEQNFGDQHMFNRFQDRYNEPFQADADSLQEADIVWGIVGVSRPNFDPFIPEENRGIAVLDENFALHPKESQEFILDVCTKLRELECDLEGCTKETMLYDANDPEFFLCFMEAFQIWHVDIFGGLPEDTFALSETNFNSRLKTFTEFHPEYQPLIGFNDNDKPVFAAIRFRTTLVQLSPVSLKQPVLNKQNRFLREEIIKPAPDGLKYAFIFSFDHIWIETELGIVAGMFQGLAISFPIAFLVVLFATGNILIAIYATCSVGAIVIGVLGVVKLIGWALGIGEAIAAVFVVGLSVDYVIHLGHLITHSTAYSRVDKTIYASSKMGGTVLAGAITTGGASIFMFVCQLDFFNKMATLIALTVSFSLIFAVFFFLSLNILIGPDGDFGNIYKPCRKQRK